MSINQLENKVKNINILPITKIPILKPASYWSELPSLRNIILNSTNLVKEKINTLSDWIVSFVPKSAAKVINKKLEVIKKDVKKINIIEEPKIGLHKTALKRYLKTYRIKGDDFSKSKKNNSFTDFLGSNKQKVLDTINNQNKPIKLNFILSCKFIKYNPEVSNFDYNQSYFHTKNDLITEATDLDELYSNATETITEKISIFANSGSGWVYNGVDSFDTRNTIFADIPSPQRLIHTTE